uniref:Centriolar satellite-associated tubulin polyglutamylase complex regulator 1 n=1 Tax=Oncorhynchus kisutch TaxID=8019 RepID=A0A8C7F5G0_ONCKI
MELSPGLVQSAFNQTLGDEFTFQQANNLKHKAISKLELLTKKTVKVSYWPSYIFYLNLIENLWQYMKMVAYFSSVKNGNHVLFREFSYIKVRAHKRASFIHILWRCFRHIGKNLDFLAMLEYNSLLQLPGPDSLVELVQHAARSVIWHYSLILYSITLHYGLLSGKSPNTVIIPTSASGEETEAQEGVGSSVFGECMEGLCERNSGLTACSGAERQICTLSAWGFELATFRLLVQHSNHSNTLTTRLPCLPNKSELLIDPDMDQEVDKLGKLNIAQIAISPTAAASHRDTKTPDEDMFLIAPHPHILPLTE